MSAEEYEPLPTSERLDTRGVWSTRSLPLLPVSLWFKKCKYEFPNRFALNNPREVDMPSESINQSIKSILTANDILD